MTLVVAWKEGESIRVAADTRLSQGDSVISDTGGKIFVSTVDSRMYEGDDEIEQYQQQYGFAFCGSTLLANNTHSIASTCAQMFRSSSEKCAPSLLDVTNLYRHVSSKVTYDLNFRRMGNFALFEGLIFGYCPENEKFGIGRIIPNMSPHEGITFRSEVNFLEDGEVFFMGSGSDEFRKQLEIRTPMGHLRPILHMLESVIDSDSEPSVGGDVQLATASQSNVEISAILKQSEDNPDQASITVNGISVDLIDGLLDFTIGRTVIGLSDPQKIARRAAIRRAGYNPDVDSPPNDEVNTAAMLNMIDAIATKDGMTSGLVSEVFTIKAPVGKNGQHYFSALCGCGSVTPILEDLHKGVVKTPFTGDGYIAAKCQGCSRTVKFKATSIVSMEWNSSLLNNR
ncbi:hypothetical protein [Photobacterium damselae]|uniref:hypothetical protein n=1 Tax=Photobacterium damselae TaxID=38293 RepID=UPI001EFDB8E6|nr:hypothetical protein [Photobacterium damselae]MCG9779622.1 hypothetical protein [Photobacterium damselae]